MARENCRRHNNNAATLHEKYLFGNLEGAAFAWVCGPQRRLRRLEEQAGARLVAAGSSPAHFRFRLDLMCKILRVFLLLHFPSRADGLPLAEPHHDAERADVLRGVWARGGRAAGGVAG